jgi:hypothetical protein
MITDDVAATRREYYPLRFIDVAAIATFWAVLSFVSSLGLHLDPRIPNVAHGVVAGVVTATYVEYAVWAMLTAAIWWLATRYSLERGQRVERVIAFALLGIVIAIAMDVFVRHVREGFLPLRAMRRIRRPPPLLGGLGFLDDLMVYFAVLGSGVARDYFLRYRMRLEETVRLQAQLSQARLDVLRNQLNPHFLFNTLNAVSALVERDPRGSRRMIARLSDLLRYTLEESTEQEVPLNRELDMLGEYIELMQIRFQGRLQVDMRIADDTRDALVPNLVLQPLLENALKHGVSQITGEGRIDVEARRSGDELRVTVRDNGPGPARTQPGQGVGLTNTNARVRELYGSTYGVTLSSANGGGAEAELVLPFHTTSRSEHAD